MRSRFGNDGRPFVFLNTQKSAERSRVDACHESGRLLLHWRGSLRGQEYEREADRFASALLMPAESAVSVAPRGADLDHRPWNPNWGAGQPVTGSCSNPDHHVEDLARLVDSAVHLGLRPATLT